MKQQPGALSLSAAPDILRDNLLHLPPRPRFKYFPIFSLQSRLPTGVAIMVETVSITLSAEAGKGKGRREGDWRCQRQQCRPILSTGLIYWTFWPPKISSLLSSLPIMIMILRFWTISHWSFAPLHLPLPPLVMRTVTSFISVTALQLWRFNHFFSRQETACTQQTPVKRLIFEPMIKYRGWTGVIETGSQMGLLFYLWWSVGKYECQNT